MSKEDARSMMAEMMSGMLADMNLEDRIVFMQSMIGACISKITEGLGLEERDQLAQKMLSRMASEIKTSSSVPEVSP